MQLERYRIESEIGRGAMATVFRAYDTQAERPVALKLLHRKFVGDEAIRGRFVQEAKTIAQLRHRAIVPIIHAAQVGEDIFLVMPLMEGGSLADRLHKGPLSLIETLSVLERIASALDYAHANGIVHRDVKPDNILFDESSQAYLGDFGIIKVAESKLTLTGTGLIGTPAYMSPEQIQGAKDLDGRSDIYALGVVLFEMLSGQVPFDGDSEMAIAMKHVNAPVPSLREYSRSLSLDWQKIVNRAMAKAPKDRFQNGAEMIQAINVMGRGQDGSKRLPTAKASAAGGRIPLLLLGMAIVVLLAIGLIFIINRPDTPESIESTPESIESTPEQGATEALAVVSTEPPATATNTIEASAVPQTQNTELAEEPPAVAPPTTPTLTLGPPPSSTSAGLFVRVITNVFTREGPGLTYPIFGSLSRDELVRIISRNPDGAWFLVQLANNNLAWVSADFVEEPPGGISAIEVAATIPVLPTPTATATLVSATVTPVINNGGGGSTATNEPIPTNTPFQAPTNTPFGIRVSP